MGKPGRPSPGLDDYLYWQERLANREASGLELELQPAILEAHIHVRPK